jgi:hypothetical protein
VAAAASAAAAAAARPPAAPLPPAVRGVCGSVRGVVACSVRGVTPEGDSTPMPPLLRAQARA